MNPRAFATWLDAYGRAWETRDPGMAPALFTAAATYQETPFDEPMRGLLAIVEYWSRVPRVQKDIRFGYEILAVTERHGIARWWASYVRIPSGSAVKLDGIFVIVLDENNLCRELREWWHRQESDA